MGWLLQAGASAGFQNSLDRTQAYNQARATQDQIDKMSDMWGGYIKQLESMYSTELSGNLSTTDQAAYNKQGDIASKRYLRNVARLGASGGGVANEGLAAIQSDVANAASATAQKNKMAALALLGQAKAGEMQSLTPLETQYGQQKAGLDASENNLTPYLGQILLPGLLGMTQNYLANIGQGGVNPMQDPLGWLNSGFSGAYNVQNPEQLISKAAQSTALKKVGVDPGMLNPDNSIEDVKDVGEETWVKKTKNGKSTWEKQPGTNTAPKITSNINSQDERVIASFDENVAIAEASDRKDAVLKATAAKRKYIENRNLIGQIIVVGGVIKTYIGNGVWK